MKKTILSAFILAASLSANAAENMDESTNLRDQKRQQLEERFNSSKTQKRATQDEAAKFETNARSNEAPPINHFEGWNKLSDEEKSAVKKHHEELRSNQEKTPTFEKKAAKKKL